MYVLKTIVSVLSSKVLNVLPHTSKELTAIEPAWESSLWLGDCYMSLNKFMIQNSYSSMNSEEINKVKQDRRNHSRSEHIAYLEFLTFMT